MLQELKKKYYSIFNIYEIENSKTLQWVFGMSLFIFYLTFSNWEFLRTTTKSAIKEHSYICWQYFQNCSFLYIFQTLPEGISQNILYTILLIIIILTTYNIYKKNWIHAHFLLLILFIWKFYSMFIFSNILGGNYDYFHIFLTLLLLISPNKLNFLKLGLVFLYFCAGFIKINDGWILGSYFTSLQVGIPLIPNILIPLSSITVIIFETVLIWFLLSKNKKMKQIVLYFFITFHIYSGFFVMYRYPVTILPILILLFLFDKNEFKTPLNKKDLIGWTFIILLGIINIIPLTIPGDNNYTLENQKIGLYMFDANHQGIMNITTHYINNSIKNEIIEKDSARYRFSPYRIWFKEKQKCSNKNISKISLVLWSSINGGPFYEIVNEDNICNLSFKFLEHNSWIKLKNEANIIGYPVKNYYY